MATDDTSSEVTTDGRGAVDPLTVALEAGELTLVGRLPTASNGTFLAELQTPEGLVECVHKPIAGERPLWDFPDGTLAAREVAAHRLSAAAGFDVVPRTVFVDGPLGSGSLQAWVVDEGPELVDLVPAREVPVDWAAVVEGYAGDGSEVAVVHALDHEGLRRLALFDVLANNADRKGGHVLHRQGRVYGVDHGLTFHSEPKLRTVLWGWAGESLTDTDRVLVETAAAVADEVLGDLLARRELAAVQQRCEDLLTTGRFPEPDPDRHCVPWPPF